MGFISVTTTPIVALGPCFQILCGFITALLLFPIRKFFIEKEKGFIKLGGVILGLSVSLIAAPTGLYEGIILAKLSIMEHMIGFLKAFLE